MKSAMVVVFLLIVLGPVRAGDGVARDEGLLSWLRQQRRFDSLRVENLADLVPLLEGDPDRRVRRRILAASSKLREWDRLQFLERRRAIEEDPELLVSIISAHWRLRAKRKSLDPVAVLMEALVPPDPIVGEHVERLRSRAFCILSRQLPEDVLGHSPARKRIFLSILSASPRFEHIGERRDFLFGLWNRIRRHSVYRPSDIPRLEAMLADVRAKQEDHIEALCALAWIGTDRSLSVLHAVRSRRSIRRPHARPYLQSESLEDPAPGSGGPVDPVCARASDETGRVWLLLASPVLRGVRLSLCAATPDGRGWEREIVTTVPHEYAEYRLRVKGKSASISVLGSLGLWTENKVDIDTLRRDSDRDGLTDVLETALGTDPRRADSDGDNEPDGEDPWPLEKPNFASPDRALHEAVWSLVLGASGGRGLCVAHGPSVGQVDGYPGPIVRENEATRALHPYRPMRMKIEIVERQPDRARVRFDGITIFCESIRLRRIHGHWFVTSLGGIGSRTVGFSPRPRR